MRPEMSLGSRATVANPFGAVGVILCWLAVIEVRRGGRDTNLLPTRTELVKDFAAAATRSSSESGGALHRRGRPQRDLHPVDDAIAPSRVAQ